MSKGNVPHRLNAAMNMRIAFDGVVPTSWVAAAKAAFSSGKTFATTGVIFSAMSIPLRIDVLRVREHAAGLELAPGSFMSYWYYLVLLCITPLLRIAN